MRLTLASDLPFTPRLARPVSASRRARFNTEDAALDRRSSLGFVFSRRILILVAVLMGLTALAASLSPPPQRLPREQRAADPSPAPATAAPQPAPSAGTVMARIAADGRPRSVSAHVGETIALEVSATAPDTVVIDDLAVSEPVDAASPAHVEIYAVAPGTYPIVLLDSGRRIGALRIRRSS